MGGRGGDVTVLGKVVWESPWRNDTCKTNLGEVS